MLANLLIFLSASVATLALLDIFLSDGQKAWLSNLTIRVWNLLDEVKRWSIMDWFKNPRATWWLAASFSSLVLFGMLIRYYEDESLRQDDNTIYFVLYTLVMIVILLLFSRWIFSRLLPYLTGPFFWRRIGIVFVAAMIPYGICLALIFNLDDIQRMLPTWMIVVFLFMFFLPVATILICVITILYARLLAYVAGAFLYVGEFVVRRIAEYPKGPVLAVSAVFAAALALIKVVPSH